MTTIHLCWRIAPPPPRTLREEGAPDELGLVGVVQRHQQLGVLSDVTDEVLQVHEQTVGVDCAEERLTPHLQVLEPRLHKKKRSVLFLLVRGDGYS